MGGVAAMGEASCLNCDLFDYLIGMIITANARKKDLTP
jgi:hypothetical protein